MDSNSDIFLQGPFWDQKYLRSHMAETTCFTYILLGDISGLIQNSDNSGNPGTIGQAGSYVKFIIICWYLWSICIYTHVYM